MYYKVVVFFVLVETLLLTTVKCEETLIKNVAKSVNIRDRRSLQFGDAIKLSETVLPLPSPSSGFFPSKFPVDGPFSPYFWPDKKNHHHLGHHQGHRNYGNAFQDIVTSTTEQPKGYTTSKNDIKSVTESDNISSETTMGVYISSAERNARKYEKSNDNGNVNRDSGVISKRKTEIKDEDSAKSKVDVRYQTDQSNYRYIATSTEQAGLISTTTEGFTSTTFATSSSSDDVGNSTEHVPVPDGAGRNLVKVSKKCHTDKDGNCRKSW